MSASPQPSSSTSAPPPTSTPLPPTLDDDAPPPAPSRPLSPADSPPPCRPSPKIRLRISNLAHPGAIRFLSLGALDVIQRAIEDVWQWLYLPAAVFEPDGRPPKTKEVRSLTVYLDDMGGVAYTCGSQLDEAHKEMHISLGYLSRIPADLVEHEIRGVVTHEMVHVFQHDAHGSAPSGLIEGVADWVRYRAGLGARHWRKDDIGDCWDAGYERTAFFLIYIAKRVERSRQRCDAASPLIPRTPHPRTFVPHLNALLLSTCDWSTSHLFQDLTGRDVEDWWKKYVRHAGKHHCSGHDDKQQQRGLVAALRRKLTLSDPATGDATDDEVASDSEKDD